MCAPPERTHRGGEADLQILGVNEPPVHVVRAVGGFPIDGDTPPFGVQVQEMVLLDMQYAVGVF